MTMIYGTKQCPECGGYPKFTSLLKGNRNNRRLEYGLVCSNSECPWNRFSIMYASRDKAIAEWNKKVMRHQESKTKSPWHTGTPTEEGWYLVAYECVHECKYKGKLEYHTMHIFEDELGYKDIRGRASDDVWKAVAWQKITPYKEN